MWWFNFVYSLKLRWYCLNKLTLIIFLFDAVILIYLLTIVLK